VEPVRFIVHSDYLCPWCYNAAVRIDRLERDTPGEVEIEWRSYLLRPKPSPGRDLERFRAYTRSWSRPGAEPDSGTFRVWQGEAGPPSHSIPPQLAAKAAARLGEASFRRMHERLLYAYFAESRDITDRETLRSLWAEAGLPEDEFARIDDPELLREVLAQHREALETGVTAGNDAVIVGAHPLDLYRRWVERTRARRGAPPSS
jgi:predicted DsbA family dithiol-disulfide isomerase